MNRSSPHAGLLLLLAVACAGNVRANASTSSIADATLSKQDLPVPEVSTAELEAILASRRAVVVDARPAREYARGHIPGAIAVGAKPGLPPSEYTADVQDIIRVLQGDRSREIVVYCNGPFCGRSRRVAADLLAAGFTHVRRYQLGMPVWRALGHPQQLEPEGLRYVLEQDRTAVVFDAGGANVPGARPLSPAEVKLAKDDGRLPMEDHHTRIVVVGSDPARVIATAVGVAHDAFDNVSFLVAAQN